MKTTGHVVLLGDSVFDNAAYVPGGPSVIEHLKGLLPSGWQVTLLAVDGAVVSSVRSQLARLPPSATHLILSIGGNDALSYAAVVAEGRTSSLQDALTRLAAIGEQFQREYHAVLKDVVNTGRPTTVCTIYDAIPGLRAAEIAGLCLFNDVILREAFAAGAAVIDLRLICNEAADYSPLSPIEPSVAGGAKIARAVAAAIGLPAVGGKTSTVVAGV
jgi:hypothetical protein